ADGCVAELLGERVERVAVHSGRGCVVTIPFIETHQWQHRDNTDSMRDDASECTDTADDAPNTMRLFCLLLVVRCDPLLTRALVQTDRRVSEEGRENETSGELASVALVKRDQF